MIVIEGNRGEGACSTYHLLLIPGWCRGCGSGLGSVVGVGAFAAVLLIFATIRSGSRAVHLVVRSGPSHSHVFLFENSPLSFDSGEQPSLLSDMPILSTLSPHSRPYQTQTQTSALRTDLPANQFHSLP